MAAILQISATSFTLRCPCNNAPPTNDEFGEASNGLLLNAEGDYYAPVVFPTNGDRVCAFSLVARDSESTANVTASLFRKTFAAGGNAFDPPIRMARAQTSGAANGIQVVSDNTITRPQVGTANSFYFVALTVPANTLEVLGVQIDVRPTCP
jgi:hypothetical protein